MHRIKLIILFGFVLTLACSLPTGLLGGGVPLDAPIPAGEAIEYPWGSARILSFHRPTAFQVVEGNVETGVYEDRPARPATGAEFISIEMEFTCAADQTVCEGPPEAVLELVLGDGRVVREGFVPMWEAWLGDEEIVGGGTVTGWVTFEVPTNIEIQALKITPFEKSSAFHGALPAPVDGYSIQPPWETLSNDRQVKELPALRRDMENAGFDMRWAELYQVDGETGLYVILYTEELFFFEDSEAVLAAQDALLTAADLWSDYSSEADYLAVELSNDLSEEIVATVGADAVDVNNYLNGVTDLETFMSLWWVINE